MFKRFLQTIRLNSKLALSGIIFLTLFTGNPAAAAQQGVITVEARVSASSDDAEEDLTNSVLLESKDLELVLDHSNQSVGLRFNQIEIPPRAVIVSAYIQFRASGVSTGPAAFTIEGEATDNAVTFATTEGNISTRPRTVASVAWSPEPWLVEGAIGPIQKTSNIASIIQEISLRPGWKSGNSLAIFITGSGRRIGESYDGLAYAAPLLHIEYVLSGNIPPAVKIISPLNRSTYNQGNLVTLTAVAKDFEEGDLTKTISWSSNLDGDIGMGSTVETSSLSVGEHTIQAIATDSTGLTGFATQTVIVFAPAPVLVGAGDIAYESRRDDETAKLLETIPGIIYTLGDNVYQDGKLEEFHKFYEPTWGRHKARTFPAIGHHEYEVSNAYGYYQYFGAIAGDPGKGYYSYDLGDWHIIVLNSICERLGGCGVDSQQGKWLQADLAANPGICTLAYFHDSLFSSSGSYAYPEVRDFWRLLYDAEVDVILNGHAHNYERFAPQNPDGQADPGRGIRQFVVGTGGRSFSTFDFPAPNSEVKETGTAGVLKLTLHPTSYDWEFIPIAGQTFTDAGSADCVTTSSVAVATPTVVASSPGTNTPIPTADPTEAKIPALTATVVQVPGRADSDAINPIIPACAVLPIPFLVYLVFLYRRQSRR